jgi:hypothetical protein
MLIAIQRENGTRAEVVMLAGSRTRMRVMAPGSSDTEEWTRIDGKWRDESGAAIEMDAIFALAGIDASDFCADLHPRATAMGGSAA